MPNDSKTGTREPVEFLGGNSQRGKGAATSRTPAEHESAAGGEVASAAGGGLDDVRAERDQACSDLATERAKVAAARAALEVATKALEEIQRTGLARVWVGKNRMTNEANDWVHHPCGRHTPVGGDCDNTGCTVVIASRALTTLRGMAGTAPAMPADPGCAGCAKVARHPGEGYMCSLHPVRSMAGEKGGA